MISYVVYLGLLSVLLGEPGQRFVNLVYPFKEPTLGFIDFFFLFKKKFLIFSLIFIRSFLLLTLHFVLLLLILLGGGLGCLFESFLVS